MPITFILYFNNIIHTIVEVRMYCVAMWRPSWILADIMIFKLGSRPKDKISI